MLLREGGGWVNIIDTIVVREQRGAMCTHTSRPACIPTYLDPCGFQAQVNVTLVIDIRYVAAEKEA